MGGVKSIRTALVALGLSLLTACNASGHRPGEARLKLYTPSSAAPSTPRVTLLSLETESRTGEVPHFVPNERPFEVELPYFRGDWMAKPAQPGLRLASAHPERKRGRYQPQPGRSTRALEQMMPELPASSFAHSAPAANDFYITLGTGIVDQEKAPSWTSAAIYPQVPTTRALPAMRVIGQSARSVDHIQVAPGFFWWASSACCVSLSVPVRVTGSASDWGVLFALTY